MHKPKELSGKGNLNCNFERKSSTIAELISRIGALDKLHADFLEFLRRLKVEVSQ